MEIGFAREVVMIEPIRFFGNPETCQDNYFMKEEIISPDQCRLEFHRFWQVLTDLGIAVFRLFNPDPDAPDAIFPNNWFSSHGIGECRRKTLVLYPMKWPSRQRERRPEFIQKLREMHENLIDLTYLEQPEHGSLALESTGSLVFDRLTWTVFMAVSERASPQALSILLDQLNSVSFHPWKPVLFHAQDGQGRTIYHTNVVLGLTPSLAVVCLASILDDLEREKLTKSLETRRTIVNISLEDVGRMCGNLLTLYSPIKGTEVIVLSETCRTAGLQLDREIVYVDITGIEKVGGGSARCMLAELF